MSGNLLTDNWLEVQRLTVRKEAISLAQISNQTIVGVYAPRSDFKGAIYQFLIGLLQTTFAPKDLKEWLKYWKEPPSEKTLEAAFDPFIKAFNLQSDIGKPAFMQDLMLEDGADNAISGLLIEAPGGNTLKLNQDIFIKRGGVEKISPYWAAIALFTLQINAPAGGQGHRVSLRGGGPLTTLLSPPENSEFNTLWHTLWLNILTKDEMLDMHGNDGLEDLHYQLPWMGETRLSKAKGSETYPQHGHPLQVYWSMPRRIRLRWESKKTSCDISGEETEKTVRQYYTQNYGINYAGSWVHPLTPYVFETGKEPYSIKAQPGGMGYRHWLELAATYEKGRQTRASAWVVEKYRESRYKWLKRAYPEKTFTFEPRLWAFGYDMDNMKARCWYETIMPVFNLDDAYRDDLQDITERMIEAASDVLGTLKNALNTAWFREPKKNPNTKKFSEKTAGIDSHFWSRTEPMFFQVLGKQIKALQTGKEDEESLLVWKRYLRETVTELFELYAMSHNNEDGDYKRIIEARHGRGGLEHYLNGSKALKKLAA